MGSTTNPGLCLQSQYHCQHSTEGLVCKSGTFPTSLPHRKTQHLSYAPINLPGPASLTSWSPHKPAYLPHSKHLYNPPPFLRNKPIFSEDVGYPLIQYIHIRLPTGCEALERDLGALKEGPLFVMLRLTHLQLCPAACNSKHTGSAMCSGFPAHCVCFILNNTPSAQQEADPTAAPFYR